MKTQKTFVHLILSLFSFMFFGCDQPRKNTDNTLIKPWIGLFEGVTAFDQVRIEDVELAMLGAMASTQPKATKLQSQLSSLTLECPNSGKRLSGYSCTSPSITTPIPRPVPQASNTKRSHIFPIPA